MRNIRNFISCNKSKFNIQETKKYTIFSAVNCRYIKKIYLNKKNNLPVTCTKNL